ncbi:PREDICTED: hybrid signal transduction histidine kinase E-like [Rhagoletis zephyria]|uniref:hybrid signal transduction histidine kinase E-like n=1 Tax=Rhagoletis zephyria TaxID=28612 RepID=UPI0008115D3F|nr:PREDICTED: hybrid signal transduction histidine kinase E-like [Rhagoletis zephyria]
MSEFDKQFKAYKADFDKITKRIVQNIPLSSNAKKSNEYKYSLITAYNNILLLVIGNSSAHTRDHKEVQGKLARCKLEGKAREAIPTEVNSVRQIKDALRNRIKPDNSKVVAGKIASLHVTSNNYTEFAKRVEGLSDALERSLIIEGMTQSKAHEMAVEQTVNVCRLNTRSDLVKSILSSTTFSDSKEVVAKMIVEQNNQVKEPQVYNNNANNSRYSNNGSRHNGNNFNNNSNRSSNNNNRNNNSNRRSNSRSDANVRALNAHAPQERTLWAEEMDN